MFKIGDMIRTKHRMWTHKSGTIGFITKIKYTIGGSTYYLIASQGKRDHWHGEKNLKLTSPLAEAMRED